MQTAHAMESNLIPAIIEEAIQPLTSSELEMAAGGGVTENNF